MVKRYAIIESGVVANVVASESALAENWVESDTARIGDTYDEGEFVTPDPVVVVPDEVTALQGMLALDAADMAAGYESWAKSPNRTFAEKAFIDKALVWRKNSETIAAACLFLEISDTQLDDLFILAATFQP